MTHPLIASEWLYGLTECLHIVGFAIAVGSIALVDLHLAGLGFPGTTPAMVLAQTASWTRRGLVLTSVAGGTILTTDGARYLAHPTMRLKLLAFGLAVLFNYTWHRRAVAKPGRGLRGPGAAAAVSLLLWIVVVFGGLFYAFT
jgi:hypothetical protein